MRHWLAGLLILLLVVTAGAEPPPASEPAAATDKLTQTLALLEQVDPQTLPVEQRKTLYLALSDALLEAGQQERALTFLAKAASSPPDLTAEHDELLLFRLRRFSEPVLSAALRAGTPLAALLRAELARRGVSTPAPADARTVGVMLPLSGRYASFGQDVRRGIELARTGPPASPVNFVYRDTAGDTPVAQLLTELAALPDLLAVIGPLTGSEAIPASTRAGEHQLPLLLLAPREGTTGRYVFRNSLTMAAQVETLADYARSEGLQRFVILHPATRQGEFCAGLFQLAVERQGGRVVARQSYPAGTIDLREPLQALATALGRGGSEQPEALFLPDDARQVAQVIPQLAIARLDQVQLLGTNAWHDPALGRMAGPLSEGAVFVDGFFAGSLRPEVRDFVTRYQASYGNPPNILAAQGYDAAGLLLSLLARPEMDTREQLRQALASLRGFPGVTGVTGFTPQGEAEKPLFLLQVQDGTVVQIN
jgi:ABC-type branched-subunit amino acid transport system substrate-binding protein